MFRLTHLYNRTMADYYFEMILGKPEGPPERNGQGCNYYSKLITSCAIKYLRYALEVVFDKLRLTAFCHVELVET